MRDQWTDRPTDRQAHTKNRKTDGEPDRQTNYS